MRVPCCVLGGALCNPQVATCKGAQLQALPLKALLGRMGNHEVAHTRMESND